MAHTVLIWNIERYGSYSFARGDYSGVHAFIKLLIANKGAEALIIQEFKPEGRNNIGALAADISTLETPWSYDYIPGALKTEYDPDGETPNFTQMQWGSNNEGYAVIWKNNVLEQSDAAQSRYNYLSIALKGLEPQVSPGDDITFSFFGTPSTDDVIASGFPTSSSASQITKPPPNPSSRIKFPYKKQQEERIAAVQKKEFSRRPVYCFYKFTTGVYATILTYHAPVETYASQYGVQLCGISTYVAFKNDERYRKLIVGGDFNLTTDHIRDTCFFNFYAYDLKNSSASQAYERSTVHFDRKSCFQQPNNKDNFLGTARDQIFARNFSTASGGVINVLDLLMTKQFSKLVLGNVAIKNMVQGFSPSGLPFDDAWTDKYNTLKNCFDNPDDGFDSYLSAAMFYRGYISDHLPLFQTFAR